jgi:predicted DNA-binding protein
MDDIKRTSVRLPEDMRQRVQKVAEREMRSVHSTLVWLIARGLDAVEDEQAQRQKARAR